MPYYKRTVDLTQKIISALTNIGEYEKKEILDMLKTIRKKARNNPSNMVERLHKQGEKLTKLETDVGVLKESIRELENDTAILVKDQYEALIEIRNSDFPDYKIVKRRQNLDLFCMIILLSGRFSEEYIRNSFDAKRDLRLRIQRDHKKTALAKKTEELKTAREEQQYLILNLALCNRPNTLAKKQLKTAKNKYGTTKNVEIIDLTQ